VVFIRPQVGRVVRNPVLKLVQAGFRTPLTVPLAGNPDEAGAGRFRY